MKKSALLLWMILNELYNPPLIVTEKNNSDGSVDLYSPVPLSGLKSRFIGVDEFSSWFKYLHLYSLQGKG